MSKNIETEIISEICKSLSLLGGKSDVIGTVASWKDSLPDGIVLSSLRSFNKSKSE